MHMPTELWHVLKEMRKIEKKKKKHSTDVHLKKQEQICTFLPIKDEFQDSLIFFLSFPFLPFSSISLSFCFSSSLSLSPHNLF